MVDWHSASSPPNLRESRAPEVQAAVSGLGFGVWGLGCRVWVLGLGFRVYRCSVPAGRKIAKKFDKGLTTKKPLSKWTLRCIYFPEWVGHRGRNFHLRPL